MRDTILIVDDKKLNIDMLAQILRGHYNVMAASSGEDAIDLLEYRVPDLVLLDLFMPGIDGFGVLKHIKETEALANIPVIFVTGEQDSLTEEKGLLLGAVDYIKKPYKAAVVSAKVRNHLELKRYRDGLERMVEERTIQLEARTRQLAASREAIIMGMSLMSEHHDKVTGDHIERIKAFTKVLTDAIREMYPEALSSKLADLIVLYSPLHDAGKIGISDTILKKTGKLTDEEFAIMQGHTLDGGALLRETASFLVNEEDEQDNLQIAIEIAEGHHEKYNGCGYPKKLKGKDIPLSARIVTLPDIYDALRSPRPYKPGFTHEETERIILEGDGRTEPFHFDPMVLETFRKVHTRFDAIYASSKK